MEFIDKDSRKSWWEGGAVNKELFETVDKWKWEELKQLLKWYFSMIEHWGDYDYLINNVAQFDETLWKLVDFSHTSYMEGKVWRAADNGQFEEYCWAYLRNLLSPFKNMIALINDFSKGKLKEDTFKSFVNKFELTFKENEKLFLDLCRFLEKQDK